MDSSLGGWGVRGQGWRMWGDKRLQGQAGSWPQWGTEAPRGPEAQALSKQPAAPFRGPLATTSGGSSARGGGEAAKPPSSRGGSPGSPLISAPHAPEEGGEGLTLSLLVREALGGGVRRPQDSFQAQPQRNDPLAKVTWQGHPRSQETPPATWRDAPGCNAGQPRAGTSPPSLLLPPSGLLSRWPGVSRPARPGH